MLHFQGYLGTWARSSSSIVARFQSGNVDPAPEELPVLVVVVSDDQGAAQVIETLSRIRDDEAWLYISYELGGPLAIESEFGVDYTIRGSSLEVHQSSYDEGDLRHLAELHYERANEAEAKARALRECFARIRGLLDEQCSRISIKAAGHESGTTARTLYEQQLHFLQRLRAESDV